MTSPEPRHEERLDPAKHNDKWRLDHFARYLFASQFAIGKRVLDIACGYGYGSRLLADAGASLVMGVDISPDALTYARSHYDHPAVHYRLGNLLQIAPAEIGQFDLITCFETLEHVAETELALANLKQCLSADGWLLISIPNDRELGINNPFHLATFLETEFLSLLRARWPSVQACVQTLTTASVIWPRSLAYTPQSLQEAMPARLWLSDQLDQETSRADCFVAVCSNGETAQIPAISVASSAIHRAELDRLWQELTALGESWKTQYHYIQTLEAEQNRLSTAWEEQHAFITDLKANLSRYQADASEWRAEAERLETEWKSTAANLEALRDQNNDLARAHLALTDEADRWQHEAHRLAAEWQNIADENADLRTALKQAEDEAKRLKHYLERLRQTLWMRLGEQAGLVERW